jgi:hypothetical protein
MVTDIGTFVPALAEQILDEPGAVEAASEADADD